MVDGYSLNQQRLQERGIEFEQAVTLLANTLVNQNLVTEQGETVLDLVADYARSWSLLQAYDEQSLKAINDKQESMQAFELDSVLAAIAALKRELIAKGEATDLFAQIRGEGLHSAIAQIEQKSGDILLVFTLNPGREKVGRENKLILYPRNF